MVLGAHCSITLLQEQPRLSGTTLRGPSQGGEKPAPRRGVCFLLSFAVPNTLTTMKEKV